MEKPILVIIDMQPCFDASQNKVLINNLCREIRRFKSEGWPILVVEYEHRTDSSYVPNDHRTDRRLIRVIGDYQYAYFLIKSDDDGSPEISAFVEKRRRQEYPALYITGVNASACVGSTVRGLGRKMPDATINVIADCCGDWGNRMTFLEREPSDFPANAVLQR